jgi:hypothetical protein
MWNQIRNATLFGLQILSHFALALQFGKQINNAQFSKGCSCNYFSYVHAVEFIE